MASCRLYPRLLILALLALGVGAPRLADAAAGSQGDENRLYHRLDPRAAAAAGISVQNTLETMLSQQTGRWRDPSSGASGFVTPLRTFKIKTGHYCREYMEAVSVGEQLVSEVQTACRGDDGMWQRINP